MNAASQGAPNLNGRVLVVGSDGELTALLRGLGLQVDGAADARAALAALGAADDMMDAYRVLIGADAELAAAVARAPLLTTPQLLTIRDERQDPARLRRLVDTALRPREYAHDIELPGLDISAGLERVGGDRAFYFKLVDRFYTSQGSALGDVREYAAQARWPELSRRAHTLRGSAANIGATELQQAAGATEQEIIATGAAPAALVERLVSALTIVLEGIENHFSPVAPEEQGPDSAQLAHATLLRMVGDYDGGAPEYFDQVKTALAALLPPAVFDQLSAAIAAYDFDAARAVLASSVP